MENNLDSHFLWTEQDKAQIHYHHAKHVNTRFGPSIKQTCLNINSKCTKQSVIEKL